MKKFNFLFVDVIDVVYWILMIANLILSFVSISYSSPHLFFHFNPLNSIFFFIMFGLYFKRYKKI